MPLYVFKQVIKTLFQLPTPLLLWVISYVSIYSQEKYIWTKQKLPKTLLLIICSSVSKDIMIGTSHFRLFASASLAAKHTDHKLFIL